MKNLKKIMHRLLFPGTAAVIISVPVSACLLAYTFLEAGEDSPVAYVSYVISAYSLTIVCANLLPMIRRGNRMAGQNPYILLSVTRYLLVRYAHRHGFEGNGKAQRRRGLRHCGRDGAGHDHPVHQAAEKDEK